MKRTLWMLLVLLSFLLVTTAATAQDLGELDGLGDTETQDSSGLGGFDDLSDLGSDDLGSGDAADLSGGDDDLSEPEKPSVQFGGYVKPLAYWQSVRYSDEAWGAMQTMGSLGRSIPSDQQSSGYSDLGARFQLTLEGFLGDKARFFAAVNLEQNEAVDASKPTANTSVVEAYAEIYDHSRTWKVGRQLVTWGYMEGVEVPTDRVNSRDFSYNSTEYEDSKVASTGVSLTQPLGDFSGVQLMWIPAGKTNMDALGTDVFYNLADQKPSKTTGNSKAAARYFMSLGRLDLALSYVEGTDPVADVAVAQNMDIGRVYHHEKSPGLDIQYSLGSYFAKFAYAAHLSEDSQGSDPAVKNSWDHYAAGIETSFGSSTVNLYAGKKVVRNWEESSAAQTIANQLMGQGAKETQFVSGHISSAFLTGDALRSTFIFASYWDDQGSLTQLLAKPTVSYKITDGLLVMVSPTYASAADTLYQQMQGEIKYTF